MIQIRDNMWINPTDITVMSVSDDGSLILDEMFLVHPKYHTDVITALNADVKTVLGQIERVKHEANK